VKGRSAYWVLLALVLGLAIGALSAKLGDGIREPLLQASGLIGGLWLNALKMTVIPLVVALVLWGAFELVADDGMRVRMLRPPPGRRSPSA